MRKFRILGVFVVLASALCAAWIVSRAFLRKYDVADLALAIEFDDEARAVELIHLGFGNQIFRPPYDEERWQRPVHLAAMWGRPRILSLLLSQDGIDPNARDFQGFTPLMYLCVGCNIDGAYQYALAFDELIHRHADVNAASLSGETALHLVSYPTFLVELLLAAGADPNRKDDRGNTPLHSACESGWIGPKGSSADAIPSLLIAGSDPTAVNGAGLTPRQLALERKRNDIVAILDRFSKLMKKQKER